MEDHWFVLAADFQSLYGLDLKELYTTPGMFPKWWRLLRGLPWKAAFWLVVKDGLAERKEAKVVRGPLGPGEFTPIEDIASGWMGHQC